MARIVETTKPKTKSGARFRQANHLVDEICPHLRPAQTAALFVYWRHAKADGTFQVSTYQLASTLGVSRSYATRIRDELVSMGVIKPAKQVRGGPFARRFAFTPQDFKPLENTSPLQEHTSPLQERSEKILALSSPETSPLQS